MPASYHAETDASGPPAQAKASATPLVSSTQASAFSAVTGIAPVANLHQVRAGAINCVRLRLLVESKRDSFLNGEWGSG